MLRYGKTRIGQHRASWVKPFCFGGNVFGWTADEKTSFDLLDAFVDSGFDFIDTADVYSSLGPAIKAANLKPLSGNG